MSVYLHDIPLEQAQRRLLQAMLEAECYRVLESEMIPLDETACGRVLASAVWAKISSPHYHASAMDGFAVVSSETSEARETQAVRLIYGKQTIYLDTGDPLPDWADAVIPVENVEPINAEGEIAQDARQPFAIHIRASIPPWRNVRPMGEDIVATQLVLPAGHTLRPVDLGAIAACGHTEVAVVRKPRVAIIPTGSELVPVGSDLEAGDIIEYNSLVLAAQINSWGGLALRYPITPDDLDKIRKVVVEASRNSDLVLINAGSSAGSQDYTAQVVNELGKLLVHGVAVRPGHPVILGMLDNPDIIQTEKPVRIPIIGVPGYPVSAALTGEIFVKPLIKIWLGVFAEEPMQIKAKMTRKVISPAGDDDYVRVAVGKIGEHLLATPLSRGAGVITSLVQADGIVIIPSGSQGVLPGGEVTVQLYHSPSGIERTILAIGSHDVCLDILAQFLAYKGRRFVSANVGSLSGLLAIKKGETHLAGSHLLDPQTGEYNLSYIRQYLPEIEVVVIKLVNRQQGLLVRKGNPLKIQSLEDIAHPEITFVNRQRGAGTRVLLDYALRNLNIEAAKIQGYDHEEYTHLAVAAAISSGRADCGLGIAAAAQALGLDFVPLFQERYDLVIPTQYYESGLLAPLRDVLKDTRFMSEVASLPGYTVDNMGEIIAALP